VPLGLLHHGTNATPPSQNHGRDGSPSLLHRPTGSIDVVDVQARSPLAVSGPLSGVTPGFKAKLNAHSMCAQESSLYTYRTKNGYRITNVTIYNIYYTNNVLQKTKSNTLELTQQKDSITPQAIDRWQSLT
jgi:hypothetical protein